jgi:hypothetical protein
LHKGEEHVCPVMSRANKGCKMPRNLGDLGLIFNFVGTFVLIFTPLSGKVTTWKSLESIPIIYSPLWFRIGLALIAFGFLFQYLNGKTKWF